MRLVAFCNSATKIASSEERDDVEGVGTTDGERFFRDLERPLDPSREPELERERFSFFFFFFLLWESIGEVEVVGATTAEGRFGVSGSGE